MISYDLCCASGHGFEGWFASSSDYDTQQMNGMIACPVCNDARIAKLPMAPSIGRKSNQAARQIALPSPPTTQETETIGHSVTIPAPMAKMIEQLSTIQTDLLKNSTWVGDTFVEEARAIHYGESEERKIHGEASVSDAEALADEGIKIGALPFPVIPPNVKN
jgi:hypothetical protein